MRMVGRGRVVDKRGTFWVIEREGAVLFVEDSHMLAARPSIGMDGVLTYERHRSSALVNCFRAADDPLIRAASARTSVPDGQEAPQNRR